MAGIFLISTAIYFFYDRYPDKLSFTHETDTVRTYYNNRQLKSIEIFKDNLKDGKNYYYFENGNLSGIYTYNQGIKHGNFQTFYDTGIKRSEGNLFNDTTPDGEYRMYDSQGMIFKKIKYVKGEEVAN